MRMGEAGYIRRRGEIKEYFDRTALEAWKRLTGTEKVSGIRATVRAGRDSMRSMILDRLPRDLAGWRILDAGCGAGQMAVALAERGADVVAVDLSPEMVRHADEMAWAKYLPGSVRFHAGDMLSPELGRFDAVVAMDSLIHYHPRDAVAAISQLAARTERSILFTVAPRTIPLTLMHFAGRLFPRGDRAPAIHPCTVRHMMLDLMFRDDMADWHAARVGRVNSGFYISHALEVSRA